MALYGTTSRQLGEIAVACRRHASMNPNAIMRKPITLEDHQNSRFIVEPLHLLDCCLISDGAVCVIVTTKERARDLKANLVTISGMGQAYTTENMEREDWWYVPHQKLAVGDAFEADRFLLGDDLADFDVFDGLQFVSRDGSGGALGAGVLERA